MVSPHRDLGDMLFAVSQLVERGCSGLDGEADLDGQLVVRDLAAFDMAARVGDFEPADIVDGGGGAGDREPQQPNRI